MSKAAWVERGKLLKNKPWGKEVTWSYNRGIHGKLLFIKKGSRTSLKYHTIKDESLFVSEGRVMVSFSKPEYKRGDILSDATLEQYDVLHVKSECPYRIEALEDSIIVEIGDSLAGQIVRLEDDYGRETEKTSVG